MKPKKQSYGKKIRAIRAYLGMTQSELAAELELTPNTIGNYELGKSIPTVDVWEHLHDMAPEMFPGDRRIEDRRK